jgi:hypothetical protein
MIAQRLNVPIGKMNYALTTLRVNSLKFKDNTIMISIAVYPTSEFDPNISISGTL